MTADALERVSVVDQLAASLRARILDGDLAGDAPLREVELAGRYAVSRHTLRAALRELARDGLVRIEPNRGARVVHLAPDEVQALFELRAALELEAAHLALARHGGRLPTPVHAALASLVATCRRRRPGWEAIADGHAGLHGALVAAAGSPRIEASYAALAGELALFLVQLRPTWSPDRMAKHHVALVAGLEQVGPEVLRAHLADGLADVVSTPGGAGGKPAG